jgi:hypothetical protein
MVSEAKEVKVEKKNKRFSLEERKALLKQYNELRKAGTATQAAAKQLKVPYITLRTWERKVNPAPKSKGLRARLEKTAKPQGRAPVVILLPNGTCVQCASVAEAIQVLSGL